MIFFDFACPSITHHHPSQPIRQYKIIYLELIFHFFSEYQKFRNFFIGKIPNFFYFFFSKDVFIPLVRGPKKNRKKYEVVFEKLENYLEKFSQKNTGYVTVYVTVYVTDYVTLYVTVYVTVYVTDYVTVYVTV